MNLSDEKKAKRNLRAIVELSRIINSTLEIDFILNNILLTCMGKFLSTKGFIALKLNEFLQLAANKGFSNEELSRFPKVKSKADLKSAAFKEFLNKLNIKTSEEICSSQECIGIIALGEKLNKQNYSDDDLDFLLTITNIAAPAIQNSLMLNELKKTNRMLDSKVTKLNSLFELSKEFGLFSESTKVARLLVYSIIGQFLVQKYAVISFENNKINILESKFPHDLLLGFFVNYKMNTVVEAISKHELIAEYSELNNIGVELIVPMQLHGTTKGLILLGKRANESEYSEEDIEYIYSIGSLTIVSIENQRLFQEALEKQKIEEDLEIARDIQRNLLPHEIPVFNNFDISACTIFSKQVGGDYYDVIPIDNEKFYIAIADVAGKGVPASLMMANIQAFLQVICRQNMKIEDATAMINDLVTANSSEGRFITFFWGHVNTKTSTLTYVNAGHNPPFLFRGNEIIELNAGGIILGVMKTVVPYIYEEVNLKKDDVLILYTDGVTEALNLQFREYSEERLKKKTLSYLNKSAKDILNGIKEDVQIFTQGNAQSDDITMIVIKVR